MSTYMKELVAIQTELKAPKSQYNKFGGYAYRKAEDITEALKPLEKKYECHVLLDDDIVQVGDRYYVRATASITNKDGLCISARGFAREEDVKKGMDASQVTGAASSYARKYALNGLFALDDNRDADAQDVPAEQRKAAPAAKGSALPDPGLSEALGDISRAADEDSLKAAVVKWKPVYGKNAQFVRAVKASPYCPKS